MNEQQIIYAVIVAALWASKADHFVMAWLTFNLLATLCVAGLLDIGVTTRMETTQSMMVIDLITGAGLVVRAGISRIVSLGYAISVPLYSLNLYFEVQPEVIFAIVFTIAFSQLGVVFLGSFGGGGSGRKFNYRYNPFLRVMVLQSRDETTYPRHNRRNKSGNFSHNRRLTKGFRNE